MAKAPQVIRNFNLFVNGLNYAGKCEMVTLPSIKPITNEHRAGGMDSPALIDLGLERLELKFTMSEHSSGVLRQAGLIASNAVSLIFRAAQVADGAASAYYITASGMYSEVNPGDIKTGDKSTLEATLSCRKYKLELAGETLIEIDVDNFKRIIDGVDQLASIRNIIDG